MAESTLNESLHGDEVIEAILDRLRAKLKQDCFFNANSSYDYFRAEIYVDVTMHDQGVDVVTAATVTVEQGAEPEEDTTVQMVTTKVDIEPKPPNVVREETGQPIPVLSQNANGKNEIKRVNYTRPSAKSAAKAAAKRAGASAVVIGFVLMSSVAIHAQKTFQSKEIAPAQPSAPPPVAQQQATPLAPQNPGALDATEAIAINATAKDSAEVQQRAQELEARWRALAQDIARNHPGFHLNPRTGTLEPNQAGQAGPATPPPPPALPAPASKTGKR